MWTSMSATLICVTQNPELAYGIFIYLFVYLSIANARMRRWSAPLFFANPHSISNISNGFFVHMFHSVGQNESAQMQSRHSLYCWFIQDDKLYILTTSLI